MQANYHIDDEEVKAKAEAVVERLARIEHLLKPSYPHAVPIARALGRNVFARTLDAVLAAVRKYAPPVHWLVVAVGAVVLFIYAWLVALTARLKTAGEPMWPDVTSPCVIALWHRDAPSLLVAFARRRPRSRCVIMIAQNPRGDCLALIALNRA